MSSSVHPLYTSFHCRSITTKINVLDLLNQRTDVKYKQEDLDAAAHLHFLPHIYFWNRSSLGFSDPLTDQVSTLSSNGQNWQ